MLLTITCTPPEGAAWPATDLGFLLHKNPDRVQAFEQSYGTAHVVYPEATAARCTAALMLEIDPIRLVRGRSRGTPDFSLGQYVNDRPYAASSLLSVAIGAVFRTALHGRCTLRPELVETALPLRIELPAVPCRGGAEVAGRMFAPLGWAVTATPLPLDPAFPEWGDSHYLRVELSGTVRLSDALSHLYVLLPVLDGAKHYWLAADEVDKLIRAGGGWLAEHPERGWITRRYLARRQSLVRTALARLAELEEVEPEALDAVEEVDDEADSNGAGSAETRSATNQAASLKRDSGTADSGYAAVVGIATSVNSSRDEEIRVLDDAVSDGFNATATDADSIVVTDSGNVAVADTTTATDSDSDSATVGDGADTAATSGGNARATDSGNATDARTETAANSGRASETGSGTTTTDGNSATVGDGVNTAATGGGNATATDSGGRPMADGPSATVIEERGESETSRSPTPLAVARRAAVRAALHEVGARRVLDLGCGEGTLLRELLSDKAFTEIVGVDVSMRALHIAERKLRLERLPERVAQRLTLRQGALTYTDARLRGYDAAVLMEVIEHVDLPRLGALEHSVFAGAAPGAVLVTTPNAEFNVRYETLAAGTFRHVDHRFEWTRAEFAAWADGVAARYGYTVRFVPIGEPDAEFGAPTQMAVFTKNEFNNTEVRATSTREGAA
ncbi:3' terminal RNA ribose 2'-O-methyltransferase Hen1 [Nocardia sp. NPDC060256]|uniref:3' terminal RNA ribose 2'-O-methyltransferase Hen1 n=1 Tax=unclassified Nocardia TaxID=2637762 RepID=UPI00365E0BF1